MLGKTKTAFLRGCVQLLIFAVLLGVFEPPSAFPQWWLWNCIEVTGKHPSKLPYRLAKLRPWFQLEAKSSCSDPKEIKIQFKRGRGPILIDSESERFTVIAEEPFVKELLPPEIGFIGDVRAEPGDIEIKWFARSGTERVGDGIISVTILQQNKLHWELNGPDGNPVTPEFLLAFLSVWTQPEDRLEPNAECVSSADRDRKTPVLEWLKRCYEGLFRRRKKIRVLTEPVPFLDGQQIVLTPDQVLEMRWATQLEASLLLGALAPSDSYGLVLFAVPEHNNGGLRSFFLAWKSSSDRWQGLDMGRVSAEEFDENLSKASERLRALLVAHPGITRQLETDGVFLDDSGVVAAVDFNRAAEKLSRLTRYGTLD